MSTRHLLLPMQPTPNGRLHIGHGGGPYLRADVLARAIRRDGGQVAIITGTDAYENWVLADALTSGRSPAQTCAYFHAGISADLANLGVQVDTWIDPLSAEHAGLYTRLHHDLLQRLRDSGAAQLQNEQIPVGASTQNPIVGVWIAGRCPTCRADCGGNTCTSCGDSFTPEEILDPRSRLTDEPLTWASRSNWFVQPPDPATITAGLEATGLSEVFLEPARRYVERRQARIRLSQPGTWGVSSPLAPSGSVLSNSYTAYSLYCAQVDAQQHGEAMNAMDRESDVQVTGFFGTDNSIGGLVAPHVIAQASRRFRPHDHTVVNHMLHFEGRKCSTSQRHGLWISDLIEGTSLTTDELRYALCHLAMDQDVVDVTSQYLVEQVNTLRRWRRAQLRFAMTTAAGAPPAPLIDDLQHQVARQSDHLAPQTFSLACATTVLDEWMFDDRIELDRPDMATGWLLGTAILAAPITPHLANDLWAAFSLPGSPHLAALTDLSSRAEPRAKSGQTPATYSALELITTTELLAHTQREPTVESSST